MTAHHSKSPALYSHFDVISCNPCKAFFRRNAENAKELTKCNYDEKCEINVLNRRVCSYCRLMKCFACGMKVERIRCSRSGTTSMIVAKFHKYQQLPTLNLLQSDQSTLTIEQWNLISNLLHCYDEYGGLSIGEHFIREQNALPIKLRLKSTSLIEFTGMALDGLRFLYEKNQDFLSLSTNDRLILLQNTFKHMGCLTTNFILYKVGVMDYPMYYDAIGKIANPSAVVAARRLATQLDFDVIIMTLILAILSFSTINHTVYSKASSLNISNIKQVLYIQDVYIELLWRYLLYRYNFEQAIKFINNLIRCIFTANDIVFNTEEVQWYTDQTDSLVQQTKKILTLND
ncbi:hypothetical protein I4U23_003949 [Adineta vaga]|nr:hypothetical protein I4U23_003949 [Adineta vaga]